MFWRGKHEFSYGISSSKPCLIYLCFREYLVRLLDLLPTDLPQRHLGQVNLELDQGLLHGLDVEDEGHQLLDGHVQLGLGLGDLQLGHLVGGGAQVDVHREELAGDLLEALAVLPPVKRTFRFIYVRDWRVFATELD